MYYAKTRPEDLCAQRIRGVLRSYCARGPGTTEAPPIALHCAFKLNCPYCTALLTIFLHSCTALPIYTACTVVIGLPLLHCRFDTTA